MRRQVSLYLPEPARATIDAVRQRVDPIQYGLIPAHITLCRDDDVTDWAVVERRLAELGRVAVTLEFGPTRAFDGGGLLLPVITATMEFDDLRARLLAGAGQLPRPLAPHITLRHPRNVARLTTPIDHDDAGFSYPAPIHFTQASLIEQADGDPWRVIAVYPG
ncbi:MAG: 2'-5' RNA ligase family protein [Vicinamibacterales bacterium]|jgi:2'-5' RNA ligase|nr:2'-5' RNA ligase family protein [Vicinamibacterales bacterium]MDP7472393.1 2'-5' RNA ligase family protein [Vicinamibacterales bacterium]MDP7670411.1 2'-5' RNA ligase family protein [Vicinamibacterales bacterium]HJO38069.1 2'-5' RNA ligase family protein [Vicinamibacterales bacterium]|tara:strand:+ start:1849 stop:2337 length:489 start_codon:yes stop_codon:yes gene_type:complete